MIKTKPKPCKGTHPDTKNLGCGKITPHRVLGLGKMCGCYSNFLLNTEAGRLRVKKHTLKAIRPRLKAQEGLRVAEQEKRHKNALESLKSSLKAVLHKYIRLRDKFKPCISCGAKWNEHFQAGHFYKAELYSNLKFNEMNIHGQCRICNLHKDGNFQGYRDGLIKRMSIQVVNELEAQAKEYKKNTFKWDRETLIQMRKEYNKKLKQLPK